MTLANGGRGHDQHTSDAAVCDSQLPVLVPDRHKNRHPAASSASQGPPYGCYELARDCCYRLRDRALLGQVIRGTDEMCGEDGVLPVCLATR